MILPLHQYRPAVKKDIGLRIYPTSSTLYLLSPVDRAYYPPGSWILRLDSNRFERRINSSRYGKQNDRTFRWVDFFFLFPFSFSFRIIELSTFLNRESPGAISTKGETFVASPHFALAFPFSFFLPSPATLIERIASVVSQFFFAELLMAELFLLWASVTQPAPNVKSVAQFRNFFRIWLIFTGFSNY